MENREEIENGLTQYIEPTARSTNPLRFFWPEIDSPESAIKAIRLGIFAALFLTASLAGIITIALIQGYRIDIWAYLDPALFAVIAFGLYRKSRAAAVAGIGLYLLEVGFAWATQGFSGTNLLLVPLLVIGFLNGIRGTYAYHRYIQVLPSDKTSKIPMGIKSFLINITILILVIIFPFFVLSTLILVSEWIGIDTSDPFIYIALLASLLPGVIIIFILRMSLILKVIFSILYVIAGFPSLIIYSFIFFCAALGECL